MVAAAANADWLGDETAAYDDYEGADIGGGVEVSVAAALLVALGGKRRHRKRTG